MLPASSRPEDDSSDSTTPPSEATLADESIEPNANRTITRSHHHQSDNVNPITSRYSRSTIPELAYIHTDYESSAAEDFDSYTVSKYDSPHDALLSYSRTNKVDKFQALLEAKYRNSIELNLNYKGQQKQNFSWSALHLACYFGNIRIVELILTKRFRDEVDINIQNNSGDTPLHKATLTGRFQIVQSLLSNGANVFIRNSDGLLAKQLTSDRQLSEMLIAAEQADRNRMKQDMFKATDNGDLKKLQSFFVNFNWLDAPGCSTQNHESADDYDDHEINCSPDSGQKSHNYYPSADSIIQMTDERGNTLLHLASMRGFKAICVYLLENGFDPYKKNDLGQTCLDLASYQLRQLFVSVKPANSKLDKISKERITRFEGPLLKKVRILGWKQIYVVLENGVILLFNNRKDLMNKSRRGYKYLESATCEPESQDLGMFSLSFSDRSRATFLVSQDHLSHYASFKHSKYPNQNNSGSMIELVRQKWIDAVRDHISYSTEFIRKGLKFNDDEDFGNDNGDLAALNHLLPIDTIKSYVQEARAHYSILERHSESMSHLVQSINLSNGTAESDRLRNFDSNSLDNHCSTTSTGGRLLGLIRSRPKESHGNNDESGLNQSLNNSSRTRNNIATQEFIQDNWPCILFHLRLLIESAENTRISMGQALALMEHQEDLRQNRIQDQDERCRVLEESLHALARDHHELEKSLSMSHPVGGCRSISMSTDLNEYHDAFEDFDDDKTVTPSSMSSDGELDRRIQEVMDGEEFWSDRTSERVGPIDAPPESCFRPRRRNELTDDEDELRSNCSALTVETVTEQYLSAADLLEVQSKNNHLKHGRSRLPAPMVPRDQVSIWSILKNCIGKELSKITMPVIFNEPLTMLQRASEGVQYSHYLQRADQSDDPVERMELICAALIASLSPNCHRYTKPFNPLLYETYEYTHQLDDGSEVRVVSQQVSHHPPITVCHTDSDYFSYDGAINPKIKFWGRSVEVQHDNFYSRIVLKRHKETYLFKPVACSVHNIIVGKLWLEHHGPLDVKCKETNLQANITFKQAGWFNNDIHRFDGFIISSEDKKKLRYVYGKWSNYIKSVKFEDYERYMNTSQQKLFKIPDDPDRDGPDCSTQGDQSPADSTNKKKSNSVDGPNSSKSKSDLKKQSASEQTNQSLDIPNSYTLWRLDSEYLSEYYNFTSFTLKLNELTPKLRDQLPCTDSRLRADVRQLEEGNLDEAAQEKHRLEEKQREARNRDKRFREPSSDFLWFEYNSIPSIKDKMWLYKGGYWENKCNEDRFPDIF